MIKLLKSENQIIALDPASYDTFLELGLALLDRGVYPVAKVIKGYRSVEGAEPSYWKPRGKLKWKISSRNYGITSTNAPAIWKPTC
jgi:hypothetical protein